MSRAVEEWLPVLVLRDDGLWSGYVDTGRSRVDVPPGATLGVVVELLRAAVIADARARGLVVSP